MQKKYADELIKELSRTETKVTLLRLSADKQQKEVWSSRLRKWLHDRFGVYIEDFRFQPEESTVEAEEPLSAKRWVSGGPENISVWRWLAGKGSPPPAPVSGSMAALQYKHDCARRSREDTGRWRHFCPLFLKSFFSSCKTSESRQSDEGQTAALSCSSADYDLTFTFCCFILG